MGFSILHDRFRPLVVVFELVCLCLMSIMCMGYDLSANFIFGDSIVDAGNNDYIVSLSKANYPPNGIDFPNSVPTGRYTNARTIVDILGQELGLAEFTPPYLAPTTTGSVIYKGVNYASGGGGILNKTGEIFGGRINFDAQLDNFANNRHDIISSLGMRKAVNLLRTAFFSVTMGSNDFINNYLVPILSVPERTLVSPDEFIEEVISKYRIQLTRLYSLDARKIVVVNVGPIGCIPYIRDTMQLGGGNGCVDLPNQLAQGFNRRLKDLITELRSNLPGSMFVYADAYRIVSDIIDNYKKYGFEVPDGACCFVSGKHGGLVPCVPGSKVCPDRSKYVFWDPYHPSDASNTIIAQRLLDGDLNDISPMNIRQLLSFDSSSNGRKDSSERNRIN
ncbi:hypothetical protein LUZ60_013262 [Juncus effusus]|nr:hypothetical protein LUZ60_013262 [Juncus effusus]